MFGYPTACRSLALPFFAVIPFAIERPAPCSTILRHSSLSWAAVVHWSALIPKALRPSRKHPNHPSPPPPPHAARAHQQFSEHSALRQSRALHARHKSREQDPLPARNHLDVLSSRLHKRVQKLNRVVGTIVLLPTDAASQKAMMGSAQRVVVARAQARNVKKAYSIVSRSSALSIRIPSSWVALGRPYSSRVYFRKIPNRCIRTGRPRWTRRPCS